jgi:hypothetical protein
MKLSDAAALAAVIISVFSLILRQFDQRRSQQASVIKALQGEKESVGYEAYRITINGWPPREEQRSPLRDALCLAGVFERSDRTRAMIYAALRLHPKAEEHRIKEVLRRIQTMFDQFGKQLDLKRGQDRLDGLCLALGIEPASIKSVAPPGEVTGLGSRPSG